MVSVQKFAHRKEKKIFLTEMPQFPYHKYDMSFVPVMDAVKEKVVACERQVVRGNDTQVPCPGSADA